MANIETLLADTRYYAEVAAPATPSAGNVVTYAKADGLVYSKDDAGTETLMSSGISLSNPMTTAGDIIKGGASGIPERLAIGASGTVLESNGTAPGYAYPPGYELSRVAVTGNVSINQSAQASAVTVATAGAITGDGAFEVDIEIQIAALSVPSGAGHNTIFYLYDGAAFKGIIAYVRNVAASSGIWPVHGEVRITPPASAVTYSVRATASSGTSTVNAGTGGTGAGDFLESFIRIKRV